MSNEPVKAAAKAITDFPWWNFGMDSVGDQSSEWAIALAQEVVARLRELGWTGPSGDVHEPQCDCGRPVCASLSLSEPPERLRFTTSSRGFDFMPAVKSRHEGAQVQVSESSSASTPSLWLRAQAPANLNVPEGDVVQAPVHLTVDNAWRLAEQIVFLVKNHYQNHPFYQEPEPVSAALADAYQAGFEAGQAFQEKDS